MADSARVRARLCGIPPRYHSPKSGAVVCPDKMCIFVQHHIFDSAFAIGNLLASFVNPPMASRIGRKATIVVFSAFIPVMLLVITFLPPVPVIYAAFILIGIGSRSRSGAGTPALPKG